MKLLQRLRQWWNPGFDCNSAAIIGYLRCCGHVAAASDVEALFKTTNTFKERI